MVNRVVAADWNQAMLVAVVKFGSCNELTAFISSKQACSARRFDVGNGSG